MPVSVPRGYAGVRKRFPLQLSVLIVDDSRNVRRLLTSYLSLSDLAAFESLEAVDGEEALAMLDSHHVDLIFLDWHMPRMSGIEFLCEVRKRRATNDIPVIMVTVETRVGMMSAALDEADADAFISKPFGVADIEQKLEPILRELASRRSSGGHRNIWSRLFDRLRS